jgi:thymidylate synthase
MNHLDKQYHELLFDIIENGVDKDTRNGKTRSVFGKQIRHKMKDGFPLLTTKKMYWKGIVTELIWFLRGDTNIKFLVDNDCNIWTGDAYKNYQKQVRIFSERFPFENRTQEEFTEAIRFSTDFANTFGDLGPVYGKQWRGWTSTKAIEFDEETFAPTKYGDIKVNDQIANLIRDLKTNPDSRRLMVNAWNVGELDQMTLPPCHYSFQVYTRELSTDERNEWFQIHRNGNNPLMKSDWKDFELDQQDIPKRAISLMWNQRSVDVPLGLPFNIASYGLLLEILAKLTNMVPDELIGNLGDCHIYENQLAGCREQITREPFALPKLSINDTYWVTSDEAREYTLDTEILSMLIEDFKIEGYGSHPAIKFPLSN